MTNYLKVNYKDSQLVMDKTFADNAVYVGSREYNMLQEARIAYPNFAVVTRKIKRNPEKKTYHGLTYEYMRNYIMTHEKKENILDVLNEFEEMLYMSRCHSAGYRYPVIKRWFLERYTEIAEFGMPKLEKVSREEETKMLINAVA